MMEHKNSGKVIYVQFSMNSIRVKLLHDFNETQSQGTDNLNALLLYQKIRQISNSSPIECDNILTPIQRIAEPSQTVWTAVTVDLAPIRRVPNASHTLSI